MSRGASLSNDEFRQRFEAGALDLVAQPCWLIRLEPDYYVVSFEPRSCTGASKVPAAIIEEVQDLGRFPCQGDNGVWMNLHRIILFIKKPTSPEGSILFEMLLARSRSEQSTTSACSCEGAGSQLQYTAGMRRAGAPLNPGDDCAPGFYQRGPCCIPNECDFLFWTEGPMGPLCYFSCPFWPWEQSRHSR
jgi:hypothetical protein